MTPFNICSGNCPPPTVTITPAAGTFTASAQTITVDWCGQAALSSSSRSIVLNGVTVTGSFNYATSGKAGCTNHASSTGTVTLAVGSNSLFASIDDATPNTGSASADYTLMPAANHLIDTAPHNGSNLDVSKCIANCGGDVVLTYSTPAYRSMDTDRSLTFVYRDIQSHPTATITLNVQDTSHTRTVDVISMKVLDPGGTVVGDVKGGPERFFYNLPHQWMRLAARFIVGSPTGAYDYSAVITSYYTDGTSASTTVPVRILVTNEQGSPYGGGWTIAGVQRVYPQANGSIVLTDGTGTVQYYAGPCASAPCSYVTPRGEFSVLSRHSWGDGTLYDRRAPDGSVVAFGSDGRAAYAQDRFGNRTSYSYDPSGRLAGVTDPVGKVIYIASAGTSPYGGPILTITDPGNRVTTLNLNSSNDLVSIVDPAGGQPFQNGSYWSGHYLKAWQDRRGGIWGANRDCAAHVSSIASPLLMGDTVRTLMTHQDVQTTGCAGTNGRGDRTAPATASVPDSVRAIVTNPRGYATRYAVDVFGAPTRIEDALGRATIIQRDSMSRVTRVVTPSGHTVASTWTGPNVTQAVDSTTGRTINYAYDARYNLQLTVSGQAVATTNYLNAAGTLIDSTRVGGAAATRYRYDSRGRDTLTTDPEGHATRTHFDSAWGSADIVASGGGRLMAYAFDGMGRVTGTADALYDRSTTAYDVLNRVRYSVGPRGDTTTFSYDSLFLWKVVDALHQAYQYDRNALGWVETLTDPGSRADHFAYDQNGNVTSHTNRRGQMVTTAYDQLDRPTQLAAAPADTTRYAYDPSDHWTSASNAASVDTLKFDGAGRTVAEIVWRAGRRLVDSSYYNSLGLRSLVRWDMDSLAGYVKHGTAYGYDQSGQLDSLIPLPSGGLTSLGFNGDRLATTVAFPTGVIQSSTFSSIHQSSQTTYSPAGSAIDLAFQRAAYQDSLGRIGERYTYPTGSDTSRVYAYDGAGQLIGYTDQVVAAKICHPQLDLGMVCTQPNPQLIQQETYSYDLVGNRTDSATAVQAGNRLPSFHGYTLAYDADGNLVSKNKAGVTDSLEWNALGQLTRVRRNGAVVAEFAYDGFGRRISKTAAGTTRFYQWDGDNIVTERDAAMSILVEYAFYPGEDAPHSVQAGGASYVVATEAPGHVIGLMSASGTGVAAAYRYRPFGLMEHDDQTIPNSLRFQGRPYDAETGLYYFRARYYDPELGRFVSEDPIGLEGGVNQYAYAGNDPVNGRDPMGLDSCGNCGGWEWPFSWETFLAMIHQNHQGDDGSGGGGSGGGGSSNPKPDVVKNSKRVMACNRSANTVMAALQHNFTDFASFSSSYTPALAFNAPSQLGVGTSIPISMFAPINGTVISYNTSVTVKSMSPTSLTFVTVPGHSLYPATISFSASGAGQSQIQFGVDIRGNFANLGWEAGYYLGGSLFEDAVWSNLMDNVATFCGSKQ